MRRESSCARSMPAQKTRSPAPVSTAQRISGSPATRSQAAASARRVGGSSAFARSGRSMVTSATCGWSSGSSKRTAIVASCRGCARHAGCSRCYQRARDARWHQRAATSAARVWRGVSDLTSGRRAFAGLTASSCAISSPTSTSADRLPRIELAARARRGGHRRPLAAAADRLRAARRVRRARPWSPPTSRVSWTASRTPRPARTGAPPIPRAIAERDRRRLHARPAGQARPLPRLPARRSRRPRRRPACGFEILVVDNAPSDERTREIVARAPGVRYVLRAGARVSTSRATARCARPAATSSRSSTTT